MISVEDAQERVLALAKPLPSETVPLAEAAGRVLSADAAAARAQPPFDASAMDGYAVSSAKPGATYRVIGEAAAGKRFHGTVKAQDAVRIFTGAPVPSGANTVVIQEDVTRTGDEITVLPSLSKGTNIRRKGADFTEGEKVQSPQRLGPHNLALLAAMNIGKVTVAKRPDVAIIGTGDELVMPGTPPGEDQIVASNLFGLKALIEAEGAHARMLPIARDTEASLNAVFDLTEGADLIVTVGGASVGEHDLVAKVVKDRGMEMAFHKVSMRPGKPLMSGRLGEAIMLGLPGNPVSALVCAQLFLAPLLRAMQGLTDPLPSPSMTVLGCDVPANGPRTHFMRAKLDNGTITPFEHQDSALLSVLAQADALLIRPIKDPARKAGEVVSYLSL